jgi:DNA ligase D-like protein (predicted polymerase)
MAKTNEFGEPVEVTVDVPGGTRTVPITNPNKVMFPSVGARKQERTKLDLARYYVSVGDAIMRTLNDRPVLLERYPNGVRGKSFFQKRIPESAPDWLQTTTVETINGTPSRALVIADLAHVLWAANQGVLGLHVWQFRASEPHEADEMRIDLDPMPGVTFDQVRESAALVRDYLAELAMVGFAKTTGSKGIHVYVRVEPGWDSFAIRGAVVALGRELSERHPDLITDKWWKEERGERVFVDFNQNAPHKNMFGAWCARPRVGAQVSTPFGWDELDTINPETCTIDTVPHRLASLGDPWELMDEAPCSIVPLVERFAADLANGIADAPWPPQYPKMPNEAPRVQPSRARQSADSPADEPTDEPTE